MLGKNMKKGSHHGAHCNAGLLCCPAHSVGIELIVSEAKGTPPLTSFPVGAQRYLLKFFELGGTGKPGAPVY